MRRGVTFILKFHASYHFTYLLTKLYLVTPLTTQDDAAGLYMEEGQVGEKVQKCSAKSFKFCLKLSNEKYQGMFHRPKYF